VFVPGVLLLEAQAHVELLKFNFPRAQSMDAFFRADFRPQNWHALPPWHN